MLHALFGAYRITILRPSLGGGKMLHTDFVLSLLGGAQRTGISPRRVNRIIRATLLLVGLACVQPPAFAQQPATISGFLADPTGSGVPGASLTLTNQDT